MDLIQFGIVLKAFDQMSGVFGTAAGKSMGAISSLDARVGALSGRLDRLGTKAMGDGALLTGMMQKPIAAFAQAEDAATGLKVSMLGAGGALDARYGKISKLATDLGDKLPGTTADFQNMMTALVKQGISYDAILGGVGKSAAYLGVLLKKPPEQAAEFVAKLQDATGTVEGDMMGLMDTIQRATYLGVNDNNMLQFYTKMTPAMDTMKRKGSEAAKAMAPFAVMFDQAGMQGEAAGNALRKVVQLGMDTKKVAKANAELASKGIKLDFTDGKGEFGGMGNMMLQLDKLKGLTTTNRLKAFKEVFGDEAETMQVLSILINKGVDGYKDTVGRMENQADLQRRVNEQLGTLKNLWDAASGTFTNTLSAFGATISPELKALTEWLGDASAKMSEFIGEHPKLAKAAGLAVAGMGGVLLVGGALAMTLGTITRLAGYALGPLGKLGGLVGKKDAAGKAAEAAGGLDVQRVWVTNWPGSGLDLGGGGGKAGTLGKASKLGKLASVAGKGLGVVGAGMAGYELGTMANEGITQVLTATNGGKERTLGTWLYDLINGDKDAKLLAPTPIKRMGGAPGAGAKAPVPLNPVAASKSNAQGQPGKVVAPQVTLHYNPALTIQGDPIPGTDAKFKALLNAHRDELLRMINQAVENKARAAY
ncbi:phage tail tape measure protein [Pseudogulbenkiania sp. NH8B]|uniref:phage tail tape measure protein n=1 Tax=Pseudogulbenkiania sp. (strain NH8B) TaxID=748280 RepID=UPI00022794F7|nr:phage tail tape measure protein [Pseudogulbenkiania sp. NH8B]BAK75383.1 phage tail tape measure protein [Pseudogulbenkiania sp. NH8B]